MSFSGPKVAVQPPRRLSSPSSPGRIETKRGAERLRPKRCTLVALIWSLLAIFTASCGGSNVADSTADVAADQPVEYGASLQEWEEAVEANDDQVVSSDEEGSGVVQSNSSQPAAPESAAEAPVAALNDAATNEAVASTIGMPFTLENVVYQQIMWDGLIPLDFRADAIMEKYQEQLAATTDGSPEAATLFSKMQDEFNNAPVNGEIDETLIRLPGFIAPLEYSGELITEFLLVPYFGACIHTPPPPANQTVLVKTAEGQGIKTEDSYNPIWVMGKVTAEATTTELAAAGYYIQEAIIEPYTNQE